MAQYQLSEDQFLRAMAVAGRRVAVLLVVGAIVVAVVAGVYGATAGVTPRSLILAAVPAALVFLLWQRRLRWRRVFRQTPAMQRQQTFLPDAEGYAVESSAGRARVAWQETWRVTLSREFLFVWTNETTFRIVPLGALSPEELDMVRRQVARYWRDHGRSRPQRGVPCRSVRPMALPIRSSAWSAPPWYNARRTESLNRNAWFLAMRRLPCLS